MYYNNQTIESRGWGIPEEFCFGLTTEPVIDHQTGDHVGKNFVRNNQTGKVIAVNGTQHVARPYPVLIEPLFDGVKAALGGDEKDVKIDWHFIEGGRRMCANIILQAFSYENIVGEPTALAMRIQNSVDGSLAYGVSVFMFRVACENGMWRITDNTSVRKKHTIGADPERIAKVAANWPSQLTTDAHLFNYMKKQIVSTDTIKTFLEQYLCLTKTRTQVKVNQKWLERMMVLWYDYSRGIGSNAYAFYNVLTHYGTHVDLDSLRGAAVGNRALQQERDVRTLVQGQAFKNLIDYQGFEQQQKVAA
tara:strand:- start:59 stop:973 length:915 start_codon:yes stop_codon:yes gene_type:complete